MNPRTGKTASESVDGYQFSQRLKHVNVNPPAMMPPKDKAKSLPDNHAAIIPPMAMLASNQKIQIGRLFIGDRH